MEKPSLIAFKSASIKLLMILFFGSIAVSIDAIAQGKVFRAGASIVNITPPLGKNIVGGFNPIPSSHVHINSRLAPGGGKV